MTTFRLLRYRQIMRPRATRPRTIGGISPVPAREDTMFRLATLTSVLTALACAPALAEKDGVLRVGVMNDMSGVYSDFQGAGSVLAAQLAVEDFARQSRRKAEVLVGDHKNKPDVGTAIARRWLEVEGVDMIIDMPNSAVGLRDA